VYRVFVPILACILVAARCGAAVTADVGGRQYGQQLSAMSTFNAPPRAYLLSAIMIVFLFGTPMLSMISWYAAQSASLVAFVWSHPERGPDFWDHYFHVRLVQEQKWMYDGAWWMLAKVATSGLGIGAVAWRFGISPKYSASDVSRSVTRTILWATLLVLTIHFVFALYEFQGLLPKSAGEQLAKTLEI
jgi:ABC-type transporter Mla maintaining outer membrane lipid asymmetry permease subunit MlaE